MDLDDEPLRYTGHLLRRAQQRHVAVWLRQVSTATTSVQFAALTMLDRRPGASQRQLGDLLDLDRSTIADLVARLERRRLIDRQQDIDDRRQNRLRLTDAGRRELDYLRPRVEAIEPSLTAGLTGPERQELRRLLYRMLQQGQGSVEHRSGACDSNSIGDNASVNAGFSQTDRGS